jgi:hypothetical protein
MKVSINQGQAIIIQISMANNQRGGLSPAEDKIEEEKIEGLHPVIPHPVEIGGNLEHASLCRGSCGIQWL